MHHLPNQGCSTILVAVDQVESPTETENLVLSPDPQANSSVSNTSLSEPNEVGTGTVHPAVLSSWPLCFFQKLSQALIQQLIYHQPKLTIQKRLHPFFFRTNWTTRFSFSSRTSKSWSLNGLINIRALNCKLLYRSQLEKRKLSGFPQDLLQK